MKIRVLSVLVVIIAFFAGAFIVEKAKQYRAEQLSKEESVSYADDTQKYYPVLNDTQKLYPATNSKKEEVVDRTKGYVGDYYVVIRGCSYVKDTHGDTAIVINYDFTNDSNETVMPMVALNKTAYQDGISLERAFIFDKSVYDAGIEQKKIRPGTTLKGCQVAYVLRSYSPVEFEVGELFGKPVLLKVFE